MKKIKKIKIKKYHTSPLNVLMKILA